MTTSELQASVRGRDGLTVIDLTGDVNAAAEQALNQAYAEATAGGATAVALNFERADYINSTGIALTAALTPAEATSCDVREVSDQTRVIDINGDICAQNEDEQMEANSRARN